VANMTRRRKALGLSQTALAKALTEEGLAFYQPTVQRIELGERPVRINEAVAIIKVLRMSQPGTLGLDDAVDGKSEVVVTTALSESLRLAHEEVSDFLRTRSDARDRLIEQWQALTKALEAYLMTLAELGADVDDELVVRSHAEADNLKHLIDITLDEG
jgi:transcriptional regulator with XRE-family HTH domain